MPKIPRKPLRPGKVNRQTQRRLFSPSPMLSPSNGTLKKAYSRRGRTPEVNKTPKGLTMCLRKLVRRLLAGTGWIADASIGKDKASNLIRLLIGQNLDGVNYLYCPPKPNEGPADWKELHFDDVLAKIMSLYLGERIEGSEVESYITRSSGNYFLSGQFKSILRGRQWPPHLPSDAILKDFGCYVVRSGTRNKEIKC